MEAFASALLTTAAATWVGAIVFHSAIVAPAVFVDLDVEGARRFLRTLFPRFYRLGVACGVLMVAGILTLAVAKGWSEKLLLVAASAAVMLALEILSLRMVPYINAARDAGETGVVRFNNLHRVSVILTVVILLLGLLVLGIIGSGAAVALVA